MIDIFTGIALIGAAVSLAAWGIAVAKLRIENGEWKGENVKCKMENVELRNFSSLREKESIHHSTFYILHSKFSIHTAAFIFFATIATLSAQKQGGGTNMVNCGIMELWNYPSTNVELSAHSTAMNNSAISQFHNSTIPQFPFRLESVTTNYAYSYAMPTNGIRYDKWWKRGAYEDVFRLGLGGMSFPLAGELLSSFWVYSWGMAGAHLGNASNRLVVTGTPMSAVPGRSQFWSAALPDSARQLTWQDFALNRDTNTHMINVELKM